MSFVDEIEVFKYSNVCWKKY